MTAKKTDGLHTNMSAEKKLGSGDLNVQAPEQAQGLDAEKTALVDEVNTLKRSLEQSQQALAEKDQEFKRALADYHNVLARSQREISQAQTYGLQSFVKALLPTLDTFEQAIASAQQEPINVKAMMDGVTMTFDMTTKALKDFGIEAIDPMGHAFDPDQHEAISAQPTSDHPENTVVQVVQKGYTIKDRILRPALVVVSKAEEA